MIRTLYSYIGRDLVRVTGLALLAFTLVMTVFAIIEPMRRGGLAVDRTLWLVALTLPTMMSLTLPIAALFGATMVYGRLSQDNEITACRAGGISAICILAPALVLGAAVTVASLVLISFVTPQMVKAAEHAVQSNVRAAAYNMLRSEGGVRWGAGNILVRADRVDQANDFIEGLVIARPERLGQGGGTDLIVAPKALVKFYQEDGDNWISLDFVDAAVATTRQGELAYSVGDTPVSGLAMKVPRLVREHPSWYDWPTMVRVLRNPAESERVRDAMDEAARKISHAMLAADIAATINSGGTYAELGDQDGRQAYRISAASARSEAGKAYLSGQAGAHPGVPVQVVVVREGAPYQVISAPSGTIEAKASEISQVLGGEWSSFVTVELTGGVEVRTLARGGEAQQRGRWSMGQIPVPERFSDKAAQLSVDEIRSRAEELRGDARVATSIVWLGTLIEEWTRRVLAEMHVRLAYSISCLLMVAMGAALGLMLRGGQIISAFAISVVPASVVIAMMMAGKEMAKNTSLPMLPGLLVIWAGVIALLAADAAIYHVLARR